MSMLERVLLIVVMLFWAGLGAAILTAITFVTFIVIVRTHEPNNDMAGLGVTLFAPLTILTGAALGVMTGLFNGRETSRRLAGSFASTGILCCLAVAFLVRSMPQWITLASLWLVILWAAYAIVAGSKKLWPMAYLKVPRTKPNERRNRLE